MVSEASPGWFYVFDAQAAPTLEVLPAPHPELPPNRRPPPGRYTEPGYGTLEVAGDGLSVRFNACDNARFEANENGFPELVFPDYRARFPVTVQAPAHAQPVLDIPFEPAVPPIRFHWEAGP